MESNGRKIYRSRIDWWLGCLYIFAFVVIWSAAIGSYWWLGLIYGIGVTLLLVVILGGCWYVIDGNKLIVYQFFRPHVFPIDKIKDVKKTVGYIASAGSSKRRVSIRFTDRSVMKSSRPLELSPRDRDSFMAHLKQVNPAIEILNQD